MDFTKYVWTLKVGIAEYHVLAPDMRSAIAELRRAYPGFRDEGDRRFTGSVQETDQEFIRRMEREFDRDLTRVERGPAMDVLVPSMSP